MTKLRNAREKRAWDLDHAASRIGTTPSTLSRWERGITRIVVDDAMRVTSVYPELSIMDLTHEERNEHEDVGPA